MQDGEKLVTATAEAEGFTEDNSFMIKAVSGPTNLSLVDSKFRVNLKPANSKSCNFRLMTSDNTCSSNEMMRPGRGRDRQTDRQTDRQRQANGGTNKTINN